MQTQHENSRTTAPFLRWAGGKRWLIQKAIEIAPKKFDTYLEPFLGSAAVFFSMPEKPFIISDINPDLINCYKVMKDHHAELGNTLLAHQTNHSKDYYYYIRNQEPADNIANAARFIYLNRSCFNGLYRVNKKGKFNVPIGSKISSNHTNFLEISKRLSGGKILHQDFEKTISMAKKGDFVFVDPPYTVNHNNNGFIEYNEKIFSWDDQVRLKNSIVSALDRGAMITLTNADHESIHDLYSGICEIEKVERHSGIAGKSCNRKVTSEILIKFGW